MESNDILNIILLFLGMLIGICLYMFAYSDANKKLAKRIIIVCISTSLIFLLSYYWYLENMVSVEVKSLENETNEKMDNINQSLNNINNTISTAKDHVSKNTEGVEKLSGEMSSFKF